MVISANPNSFRLSFGLPVPKFVDGDESQPDVARAFFSPGSKEGFLSGLSISHLKVDIQLNTVKLYSLEG